MIRKLPAIICLALAGCASKSFSPDQAPEYVVVKNFAPFLQDGPYAARRSAMAAFLWTHCVKMMAQEMGYSRVQLEDMRTGYACQRKHCSPAPPKPPEVRHLRRRRTSSPSGRKKRGARYTGAQVNDTPLPDPGPPPDLNIAPEIVPDSTDAHASPEPPSSGIDPILRRRPTEGVGGTTFFWHRRVASDGTRISRSPGRRASAWQSDQSTLRLYSAIRRCNTHSATSRIKRGQGDPLPEEQSARRASREEAARRGFRLPQIGFLGARDVHREPACLLPLRARDRIPFAFSLSGARQRRSFVRRPRRAFLRCCPDFFPRAGR